MKILVTVYVSLSFQLFTRRSKKFTEIIKDPIINKKTSHHKEADVNIINKTKKNPLHLPAKNGPLNIEKVLLKKTGCNLVNIKF